jgi:hypothetical protein
MAITLSQETQRLVQQKLQAGGELHEWKDVREQTRARFGLS